MSLFPAYAQVSQDASASEKPQNAWLQNSSFQPESVEAIQNPKPISEKTASLSEDPTLIIRKEKKHKHKKRKAEESNEDEFIIDTKRTKEYLTVKTISRPSVPKYSVSFYASCRKGGSKRKKLKRYFQVRKKEEHGEEEQLTKTNLDQAKLGERDDNFTGFKQEEDLSSATATYNKRVNDDPHDIKTWLEYINLQDSVYQFEKTYRKGSVAKGLNVLAERKLAIVDKALSHNQDNTQLLRTRLDVAVGIYPADELQVILRNWVEKDQGNIILWQGYIEATQCSMSHCNTPAVVALYTKCLSTLHKLRRNATMEKANLEENILKMLYQCGLFLKQAGLLEQLWTLLRLYLELNLSPNDKNVFNIAFTLQEKDLEELEEVVFNSQLPLHELWLRTEKLRESCRWLPWSEEGECEDPQRLVFPEDVNELIHPITMPENVFKLTAIILTLLKVPLLPCRHTTMRDLGLDYVPWALDSIESLLPLLMPLYSVDTKNDNLVIDNRLAVGPQYLKLLPGQEEYLEFVLTIMKNCADHLTGNDKTATIIWWLRFQKLLIILDKENRFQLPKGYEKKIKANIKNLLKTPENRNNILFYIEYALIEHEMGNVQTCFNILQTALKISTNENRCYLYRILVEQNLREGNKETALKLLVSFVLQKDFVSEGDSLNEANLKFKHAALQFLEKEISELPVVQHFLPDPMTEWIMCYGWFLYLTRGSIECGTFVEDVLAKLEEKHPGMMWQKEILYEFYTAVIFKHCTDKPGLGVFKILDDVLCRAIDSYPNNLFLLSILAKEQRISGPFGCSWWKLKSLLIKTGHAFPILFLIIIANQQIMELKQTLVETITGQKYEINCSFKNRMLSLFRHITRADMCTRRCGLVWRLYLQFVHAYFDPVLCRNVYYSAVEECPWLKALYIDAAIYIPAELAQIQDLLIEKQLRLHVTPEELDVLRN